MAGFQVTLYGRFWVSPEAESTLLQTLKSFLHMGVIGR